MVVLQTRWRWRSKVVVALYRRRRYALWRHGSLREWHVWRKAVRGTRPVEHGHTHIILVEPKWDTREPIQATSNHAGITSMSKEVFDIAGNFGRR